MGYELNIKRQENGESLTKAEWKTYIDSDPEFFGIEEFSAELEEGILTVSTPDAGLWKTDKGEVPFTFDEKRGEITVKNPDNWVIEKMISIGNSLNAVVVGEEDEIYDEQFLVESHINPASRAERMDRKWWEFWK